jgi:D-alanyl-D-alanine carboxypeptidase
VKTYGQEMADRESARPGASQHQLGTAIDFGSITDAFAETRAGRWLVAHAWEYGFSLSYPQGYEGITGYRYESWHYRFITKAGVLLQRRYFGDVQQYLLEFLDANRAALEAKRLKTQ